MKQLSEENQEWLKDNSEIMCNAVGERCFHFIHLGVIETKLLEMQNEIEELETELFNAESKAYNETEDALVKLEDKIDELEKVRDEQSQQLSDRESRMSEYLSTIDVLRKENAELKATLSNIYSVGNLREELIDYIPELENAEKQLVKHDRQLIIETIDRCLDVVGINVTSPIGALIEFKEQLQEQE